MSKKSKNAIISEDLDDSVLLEPKTEPDSSADESAYEPPPVVRPKRVLTEAQKEALARGRLKGRERLNEKHLAINDAKRAREEELAKARAEAEQRVKNIVVKKAVAIKKKEMLAKIELDEIESDDETDNIPVEAIRRVVKKQQAKRQEPVAGNLGSQASPPLISKPPKKPTPVKREEQYRPVHHYNPTEAYGYQKPLQDAIRYNFI